MRLWGKIQPFCIFQETLIIKYGNAWMCLRLLAGLNTQAVLTGIFLIFENKTWYQLSRHIEGFLMVYDCSWVMGISSHENQLEPTVHHQAMSAYGNDVNTQVVSSLWV